MASQSTKALTAAAALRSPIPSGRKLLDWLDCWCSATAGTGSPLIIRRWTALGLIATALERRVWLNSSKGQLFPNLYLFLVAPPGVGKTLILNIARGLLQDLGTDDNRIHTAASNISAAALGDALAAATRKIDRVAADPIHPFVTYNSLAILVAELGVFLPEYDARMMNTLTDLYDCGGFKEQKRGGDLKLDLPDAQLNLIGACTPSYLNGFIPPAAWDQGFMSRVIMAYSGETIIQPLFSDSTRVELPPALGEDLEQIFNLYGEFSITDTFKAAVNAWQMAGSEPVPTHPRLINYSTRRNAHTLKLSMVASVLRSSELILREEDFETARDWLVEAETAMPEIFKASGLSGDSAIIDDTFHFIFNTCKREDKPITEARIVAYLRQRLASPHVFTVLKVMESSGMIKKANQLGADGRPTYTPVPVQLHQ